MKKDISSHKMRQTLTYALALCASLAAAPGPAFSQQVAEIGWTTNPPSKVNPPHQLVLAEIKNTGLETKFIAGYPGEPFEEVHCYFDSSRGSKGVQIRGRAPTSIPAEKLSDLCREAYSRGNY